MSIFSKKTLIQEGQVSLLKGAGLPALSSDPIDIQSTPHEQAIRAVTDVLAGRDGDLQMLDSRERSVRQAVAAELLAASLDTDEAKQHRARELFIEHGYFDDAVRNLRDAESTVDRASAAQSLGLLGSRLATTPLIAALFDPDLEVREAATVALTQIQDPSVVIGPVPELTEDEQRNLLEPTVVDVQRLFAEEDKIRQDIASLEARLNDLTSERASVATLVQLSAAREVRFRAEALELRGLEAAASTQAEAEKAKGLEAEKESLRLADEISRLQVQLQTLSDEAAELAQERAKAEATRREELERARIAAQEVYDTERARLTNEEEKLRRACEEVARRRVDLERARKESEEKVAAFTKEQEELAAATQARQSEAQRARLEAEERHRTEEELLSEQLAKLRSATEDVFARSTQVEAARQKAEAEAQDLAAAHARMQEAEKARYQLEAERAAIEAELAQRVEDSRRLIVEAQARLAEQKRIDGETHQHASELAQRVGELTKALQQKEREEKQLLDEEQSLRTNLERLTNAEAEVRKRIEQAEVKRHASEEAQRQAEEKAIKVEAEAHLRAVAEEHALGNLESVRRTIAAEVQSRSDQERRLKEEIAALQKLAEEERRRLDEETQRRVQAETRLQQERERFKSEAAARLKADAEYERLKEQSQPQSAAQQLDWRDEPIENLRLVVQEPDVEILAPATLVLEDFIVAAPGPDTIRADLLSEDPAKRATALDHLVRLEGKDAYCSIVSAFDDQSPDVRNAAALALLEIDEERPVEWFTKAFEEASAERRLKIGLAIAGSGVAAEAVDSLSGGTREDTYNALCVLFLMAKTGEVEPLVNAIEQHKDLEVRRAAIRLLTLSGQSEIADAAVKRRLNGFPTPTVS